MTRPAPTGLFAEGTPIPLEGVAIDAYIRDFCARVTVTQRYRNVERHAIEAVYVFPLDEGAAVTGFAALVDGVEFVGEVKERDAAFERYDDALADGHGAYLLDQERPDVFTARIGNLPPGKEAIVRISYVAEIGLEGGDLRFMIPTTVSPRYAPVEDRVGVGQPPAEALNPPVGWEVPYDLDLTVRLEMPSSIRGIESPSHPLAVEVDGSSATVRLGERRTALDGDFVLLVRLQDPHEPRAWLEERDGESVAMIAFQPRFENGEIPSEVIFVVDRSGSMAGSSIEEARNALQLCLRSLRQGSVFNIVSFGSTHELLFPESRQYEEETLRQATEHVSGFEGDLGGTEILPALGAAFGASRVQGLPRQLIVMTDGQVTNTEAVIKLIRMHSAGARVFTLGIGAGASHHLVRSMAVAGGGEAEFIYPGERLESKVLRQLCRALTPAVTDVRVSWGGLEVRQSPRCARPVFASGRVLVYGFLDRPLDREVEVKLEGKVAGDALSFSVPLSPAKKRSGSLVTALAARTLLRELEEEGEREKATAIGVKYGLTSKWTSFVAIEKRPEGAPIDIHLRQVPVALTDRWGGVLRGMLDGDSGLIRLSSSDLMAIRAAKPIRAYGSKRIRGMPRIMKSLRSMLPGSAAATPPLRASRRPLDRIVLLQRADGTWDLNGDLAAVLGIRLATLRKKVDGTEGDAGEAARAWATALALAWLENQALDSRDEWSLLAAKGHAWLQRCSAKLAGGETWLAAAEAELAAHGAKQGRRRTS